MVALTTKDKMKLLLTAALAALSLHAQVVSKPEPAPPATVRSSAPAAEYSMSREQVLEIKLAETEIALLNKEFKIDEYQIKAQPLFSAREKALRAVCAKAGVPEEKIATECAIDVGTVQKDGTTSKARTWWNKPESAKQTPAKK